MNSLQIEEWRNYEKKVDDVVIRVDRIRECSIPMSHVLEAGESDDVTCFPSCPKTCLRCSFYN